MDILIDRQINRQLDLIDRQIKKVYGYIDRQIYRQIKRQAVIQTDRQFDRDKAIQISRQNMYSCIHKIDGWIDNNCKWFDGQINKQIIFMNSDSNKGKIHRKLGKVVQCKLNKQIDLILGLKQQFNC